MSAVGETASGQAVGVVTGEQLEPPAVNGKLQARLEILRAVTSLRPKDAKTIAAQNFTRAQTEVPDENCQYFVCAFLWCRQYCHPIPHALLTALAAGAEPAAGNGPSYTPRRAHALTVRGGRLHAPAQHTGFRRASGAAAC